MRRATRIDRIAGRPRRRWIPWWLVAAWVALGAGCAAAPAPVPGNAPPVTTVHLVSHGWHVGIAIRHRDIPADLWPEAGDFPAAEWLEVGWGDRDYYRARDPGFGLLLKAALWPTASVLHVVGFSGRPDQYFRASEVVALPVSAPGLRRLLEFVDAAHDRQGARSAVALGPGLYGDSRYYRAQGRFHVFHNCNTWTARAVQAAGYDIGRPITAGTVMAAARAAGSAGAGAPRDPVPAP